MASAPAESQFKEIAMRTANDSALDHREEKSGGT